MEIVVKLQINCIGFCKISHDPRSLDRRYSASLPICSDSFLQVSRRSEMNLRTALKSKNFSIFPMQIAINEFSIKGQSENASLPGNKKDENAATCSAVDFSGQKERKKIEFSS